MIPVRRRARFGHSVEMLINALFPNRLFCFSSLLATVATLQNRTTMRKIIFLLPFVFASSIGFAMPKQIILIRHGEEPTIGDEGTTLSDIGRERAFSLEATFAGSEISQVIALRQHKPNSSIRSIQTVMPIASNANLNLLNVPCVLTHENKIHSVNTLSCPFDREETKDLAKALKAEASLNGQVVLIAWQHETLNDLANELAGEKVTEPWGDSFDKYWTLDFQDDGSFHSFTESAQGFSPSSAGEEVPQLGHPVFDGEVCEDGDLSQECEDDVALDGTPKKKKKKKKKN